MHALVRCLMITVACSCLGCGGQGADTTDPAAEMYPGISADQLKPTLEQIAETGEFGDVQMDLMVGLEEAGYMNQAAQVQEFSNLESPEQVKRSAARIASSIKE